MSGKKHRPSKETRAAVATKVASNLPLEVVARDIGVTPPVLERLYAIEIKHAAQIVAGRIKENLINVASSKDDYSASQAARELRQIDGRGADKDTPAEDDLVSQTPTLISLPLNGRDNIKPGWRREEHRFFVAFDGGSMAGLDQLAQMADEVNAERAAIWPESEPFSFDVDGHRAVLKQRLELAEEFQCKQQAERERKAALLDPPSDEAA